MDMEKTTVYLPADLKAAVKRTAQGRGVSEAELIRKALRTEVGSERPRPRGGLFSSTELVAARDEELLAGDERHPGFGEW